MVVQKKFNTQFLLILRNRLKSVNSMQSWEPSREQITADDTSQHFRYACGVAPGTNRGKREHHERPTFKIGRNLSPRDTRGESFVFLTAPGIMMLAIEAGFGAGTLLLIDAARACFQARWRRAGLEFPVGILLIQGCFWFIDSLAARSAR